MRSRKPQTMALWILVGVAAGIIVFLLVAPSLSLAHQQVEGAPQQGPLRLIARHREDPNYQGRFPQWVWPLMEWFASLSYRPHVENSLELESGVPVHAEPNAHTVTDCEATATTPSGKQFPLVLRILPDRTAPIAPAKLLESRSFFVELPRSVPEPVDYLDIKVSQNHLSGTWRVSGFPRMTRQIKPPASPLPTTVTTVAGGITLKGVAWFSPQGKEEKTLRLQQGNAMVSARVSPSVPIPPNALVTSRCVEQDTVNGLIWGVFPSPSGTGPSYTQPASQLVLDHITLEWEDGQNSTGWVGGFSTHDWPKLQGMRAQCKTPAFGGEQQRAKLTARLIEMHPTSTSVTFTNVPVRRTPAGPRLNVGANGLVLTSPEGYRATLLDNPRHIPSQQWPSHWIPVVVIWQMVGTKRYPPVSPLLLGQSLIHNQDASGKWVEGLLWPPMGTTASAKNKMEGAIIAQNATRLQTVRCMLTARQQQGAARTITLTVPVQKGIPKDVPHASLQ